LGVKSSKIERQISPGSLQPSLRGRANLHRRIKSQKLDRQVARSWQMALVDGAYQFCMAERVEGTEPGLRHQIRYNRVPKHQRHSVRVRGAI
jgi:hypothetical protein